MVTIIPIWPREIEIGRGARESHLSGNMLVITEAEGQCRDFSGGHKIDDDTGHRSAG